jgi:osmotically-inducible protein OsmY
MTAPRTAPTLTAVFAALFLMAVPASADAPEARDISIQFTSAGSSVQNLQAFEVGGIVILRGKTALRSAAVELGKHAQSLGYSRVANLIQVAEAPNDAEIRREAERELSIHRSLAGSRISVESLDGIVYLRGQVQHEMQTEMAVAVLRNVEGIREVRSQLERE